MESGKRVRVSSVVEYSVPPTFRVTGPPKEGGEEDTGGGEILGNIGDRQGEEKIRFWGVWKELGGNVQTKLEAEVGEQDSKVCSSPKLLWWWWGLQDTEIPERMKEPMLKNRRQPDRIRELLVRTVLIVRGQRFPPVFLRQWVSGIQPAGDGGEHWWDAEGISLSF